MSKVASLENHTLQDNPYHFCTGVGDVREGKIKALPRV